MTIKKNGINVWPEQTWAIGKATQKLVKEINNLSFEIGNRVTVKSMSYGFITVIDDQTGFEFDITNKNLGKLIYDPNKEE